MKIIKELMLLVMLVFLNGYIFRNSTSFMGLYDDFDEYTVGNYTKDGFENINISINWISGNVVVKKGNDTELHVYEETTETDEKYKMHYYDTNDTLYIQFCASQNNINHRFKHKNLYVILPIDYSLDNIDLNAVSANVLIEDLSLLDTNINSVSGEVSTKVFSSDILKVNNVSGKVVLEESIVNTLKINNISGSVNSLNSTISDIEIDTVSGNVNLMIIEELGFTLSFSKVSGDLKCDFPTIVNKKKYVYDDGLCPIDISTVSGNVSIEKLV